MRVSRVSERLFTGSIRKKRSWRQKWQYLIAWRTSSTVALFKSNAYQYSTYVKHRDDDVTSRKFQWRMGSTSPKGRQVKSPVCAITRHSIVHHLAYHHVAKWMKSSGSLDHDPRSPSTTAPPIPFHSWGETRGEKGVGEAQDSSRAENKNPHRQAYLGWNRT